MTKDHRSEGAFRARLFRRQICESRFDLVAKVIVFGIGGAVDEQSPVDVAAFRIFIPGERAGNHDARVCRIQAGHSSRYLRALRLGTSPRSPQMPPVRTELSLEGLNTLGSRSQSDPYSNL